MLRPRFRVGKRNNIMIALLLQSIGNERSYLLPASVGTETGVNPVIDECVRLRGHCLEGAKMVSLILFQAIASVALIDKPLNLAVAVKDIFQMVRFKDKRTRLSREKGSSRRQRQAEYNRTKRMLEHVCHLHLPCHLQALPCGNHSRRVSARPNSRKKPSRCGLSGSIVGATIGCPVPHPPPFEPSWRTSAVSLH